MARPPIERALPIDVSHIPDWGHDLSRVEYRFICEYLIDLDDKLAGERLWSKINPARARERGHRFLRRYHVGRAIDQALATDGGGSARTQVLNELRALAFSNPKDFYKFDGDRSVPKDILELTDEQAKCITKVDTHTRIIDRADGTTITEHSKRMEHTDKKGALDSMAKILGSHKPEQFGNMGVTVNVTVMRFSDEKPLSMIDVRPNGHGA